LAVAVAFRRSVSRMPPPPRAALLAEGDHLPNVARGDALVIEAACEVKDVILQDLLGVNEPLELLAALARELVVEPKELEFGTLYVALSHRAV
jgi:hypothetical protein